MSRRVLILSTSAGAGHLRAAQAIELALKELDPGITVRNVDVLSMATSAFRRLYGQAYIDLVNKAPHVLGYFYDLFDQPDNKPGSRAERLRIIVEKFNMRPVLKLIRDEPRWDAIVNTHFLPAEIVASLAKKKEVDIQHFTVTTDFETHRLWVCQPCDHYFTATEEGAAYLASWGVPPEDITATGIPIHPVFSRPKDRASCLKNQGLRGDRTIILQLAGGFGVGPVEQIYRGLLSLEEPVEVAVVAGKNEAVKKRLEKISVPHRHAAKIFGFTDQIDELMAVADIVLSKPGGLTTSEALARGAAMAIINPIPGQESRNSDFLLENGAAIKINNIATLTLKLTQLLRNEERLAALRRNAALLARPRAAFDIAKFVIERCG